MAIPDYTTKTRPLSKLTHKEHPWHRNSLISVRVTVYFDPERHTRNSVDAGLVGSASILLQVDAETKEGHIGTYASSSLRNRAAVQPNGE